MPSIVSLHVSGDDARISLKSGGGAHINLRSDAVPVPAVDDYEQLRNKPSIEGVTLISDKTFADFGYEKATPHDIDKEFFG